jgi:putative dimethyl sulfoxide reductase chaperone
MTGTADVQQLLTQAASLRRLALAFGYPHPGHRDALLRAWDGHADMAALQAAWLAIDEEDARVAYSRLFIGASACPLHETAWTAAGRMGGGAVDLADIQGFYGAFGFTVSDTGRTSPDHLVTELEFVAALLVKQAYARFNRWDEDASVTADAVRQFLEAHLGRWTAALMARLGGNGDASVYGEAAAALDAHLVGLCEAFEAQPMPVSDVPAISAESDQVDCPMGDAAVAGAGHTHPLRVVRAGGLT